MSLLTERAQNLCTSDNPYLAPLNFWRPQETDQDPGIIDDYSTSQVVIPGNSCRLRRPLDGKIRAGNGNLRKPTVGSRNIRNPPFWHPGTLASRGPRIDPSGPRIDPPRTLGSTPRSPLEPLPDPSRTLPRTLQDPPRPSGPLPDHPQDHPQDLRHPLVDPWIYPIT